MKKRISVWLLLLSSALMDTASITLIKSHINIASATEFNSCANISGFLATVWQSPVVMFAVLVFACSPLLAFIALSRVQLSLAYPIMMVLHLTFVGLFSYFFLNEPIAQSKILAYVSIMVSLIFFIKEERKQEKGV